MTTILGTSDSCVSSNLGQGMATTWTLTGNVNLTALSTLLGVTITFTDGYTLAAAMTWKAIGGTVTNDNATSP